MVKIRLSRGGSKKKPFYHIVVTDSRNPRDGKYIERLGYFNPWAGKNEDDISFKVHPLSHPPTDKSNSNDGEHQLKHAEEIFGDGARKGLIINTYKENFAQIPNKMSNIVTKG